MPVGCGNNKNNIPIELVTNILKYGDYKDLEKSIILNKKIKNILIHEYQTSCQKEYYFKIVNNMIKRDICFSHINLGPKHGEIYRCNSKIEANKGSVFCSLCNFINYRKM